MVSAVDQLERGSWPELLHERFKLLAFGERVSGALQEQHRKVDIEEMPGPFQRGPLGRMEREADESQADDARKRHQSLRL